MVTLYDPIFALDDLLWMLIPQPEHVLLRGPAHWGFLAKLSDAGQIKEKYWDRFIFANAILGVRNGSNRFPDDIVRGDWVERVGSALGYVWYVV